MFYDKLIKSIKKAADDGKWTTYQCRTGFHEDALAGCPGFNSDSDGGRYECDCDCHKWSKANEEQAEARFNRKEK